MSPELQARLKNVANLPSPPGVAAEIIQLAQDPNVELEDVAERLINDPALSAKILKIANSPLYAQRRKCTNLRQAMILLGLNATVTLSLSFSLLSSLREDKPNSVDYSHYWRRSLLAGAASRAMSDIVAPTGEELFLAALLQDIGMLVLDRALPGFYSDYTGSQKDHEALCAYEKEKIDADHAEIGAWLLESWNIPEYLQRAVGASHSLEALHDRDSADELPLRCVALSGYVADLWLQDDSDPEQITKVADMAEQYLKVDRAAFGGVMSKLHNQIPETEKLFEMDILESGPAECILEQARETLMIRNLQSLHEVSSLKQTTKSLKSRAMELEEESRRDQLTGVTNRGHLDELLAKGFSNAQRFKWPFSIVFTDLDNFKQVNDTYGHQAGDQILRATADILRDSTRDSDTVARYGGEEFVLVLPGTDKAGADVVGERVVNAFRNTSHDINGTNLIVTTSVGIATLGPETPFESVEEFVRAADQAVYAAKAQGKNRVVHHDPDDDALVAQGNS